jgi:hypothetical protein
MKIFALLFCILIVGGSYSKTDDGLDCDPERVLKGLIEGLLKQ